MSALAVMLGAQARAGDAAKGSGKIEDPARVGQPGGKEETRGATATPSGTKELSGKLLKADPTTVYLEHMGAVVPMKVDENTRFSGEGVKSSRDLTEGQEVRASFTVKETTNVADKITVDSASGARPEMGRPEALPPGHPPVPPERSPVPRDPGVPPPVDPGGPSAPKY